ncbi:MAG TPA: DUF4340 domain-containing protein, partial [Candidatus Polarisedimenticolia bacterium]|nr:DUF4340 domain-containing protein [Candidatus Polarisedimenticolia bacterium]
TPGSTARSVTLARQGEGWRIESPISFPADATKIQDAWWELQSAEAEAFEVDRPGEADLARFGLSRPRLSLTVEPKDGPGPIRIDFSREEPSGPVHARRSGREAVMRVGGKILETLEAMAAGVDDLRDARVAPVDRFRLARVAVRQPGAAAPAAPDDLLLFKDEESRWHRGAEDGAELPSEEVNALLDAILDMKGDSFVDNPRIDSSSGSVLNVELTERGEEARSVSVTIGPDRGEATRGVTSSTTSSVYRVPAAAVGTLLERVAALRSAKETPAAADGGSDEPDDTP